METLKSNLLKLIGHRFDTRFDWGEFNWHPKPSRWQFGLYLSNRHESDTDLLIIKPLICSVYLYIPTKLCRQKGTLLNMNEGDKQYGFYVYDWLYDSVFLFGTKSLRIRWPWANVWQKTEILDHSFNVVYSESKKDKKKLLDNFDKREQVKELNSKTFDYTYTLKNGDIQKRTAKVYVERMTWGWFWFPFIKNVRTSICFTFNEEVGEGTGSYKGGCISTGYDMLPGESVEQCFRRMEKNFKFK